MPRSVIIVTGLILGLGALYLVTKTGKRVGGIDAQYVVNVAKEYNAAGYFKTYIDPVMVASIASIESGFNPNAIRVEKGVNNSLSLYGPTYDASLGLMQVLTSTAVQLTSQTVYNDYNKLGAPTIERMKNADYSIYLGMALIDWLQARAKRNNISYTPGDIVQWYNGGYKSVSGQTVAYLARYTAARATIELGL